LRNSTLGKMRRSGFSQRGPCEDHTDLFQVDQADVLVGPGIKRKETIVKIR
jgi:hypothetical protein